MNDIDDRNINIIKKLEILEEKINRIEVNIDLILSSLKNDISENCKKMNNHINFIENIYENVKYPLNYICKKVSHLSLIEDKKILLTNSDK